MAIAGAAMTVPVWGYMQLSLVGGRAHEVADEIEQLARGYGGSARGRIFFEKAAPIPLLWSLLSDADEQADGQLIPRLRAAAAARHVDLGRLLRAAPPTTALWRLLDALALSESQPGVLVVPAPEHFDGLGLPRGLVLHRITATAPNVAVTYLALDSGWPELSLCAPDDARSGVLADVTVHAAVGDAAAIVHSNIRLGRRGLSDLRGPVTKVVHVLVSAAAADEAAARNSLRVQVRCPPGARTLAVEVWETHDHSDDPVPTELIQIVELDHGGSVHRCRSTVTGATVTRCEIPLPDSERTDPAGHAVLTEPQHRDSVIVDGQP